MQIHNFRPRLHLDILSSIPSHFEKSRDVSSFMQVCRALYGISVPHLLDPKREGVTLRSTQDALAFITFMSATSHSHRRFNSLSDLRIYIAFDEIDELISPQNAEEIGRSLAEILRRSVNLERLSFSDSILSLDDPEIFAVFKDLKSHRRLQALDMSIGKQSGCRLLNEIGAVPLSKLRIGFGEEVGMGPEMLLPFASTVTCLNVNIPYLAGLRRIRCPNVRELCLVTSDNLVTSDILVVFPRVRDFTLVGDWPFPYPLIDEVTALARRGDNQGRLIRDNVDSMKFRYVEGSSSLLYMMKLLPGIRELNLSSDEWCRNSLKRAIQVVRDCSPKVLRISVEGSSKGEEVKERLQELSQILNTTGTTHFYLDIMLKGQALLASMSTLASILAKFTTLEYLLVRIQYNTYCGVALEPHALDAGKAQNWAERDINRGLLECVANAIARGNPSLKQVGFAWLGTSKRGYAYWEVLRPGDKKGGSDEVRWQTLVVMDEFKGRDSELKFWASTKEKDEKLGPGVGMS